MPGASLDFFGAGHVGKNAGRLAAQRFTFIKRLLHKPVRASEIARWNLLQQIQVPRPMRWRLLLFAGKDRGNRWTIEEQESKNDRVNETCAMHENPSG